MKAYELLVWTDDMVKKYWDYEAQFPKNFFTYSRSYEIIRQIKSHLPRNCTVLDYGCGPGNLIGPLLEAGFRVAGLDTSSSARQQVVDRFGNDKNFLGSFNQSEINTSGFQFDAIIVAEVIEHLYDEQLDSLLKTLKTLSTPETRIIFTTPNEEKLEDSYIMCPVSGQLFHRWQHVRNWSQASVKSYLDSRNFTVITSLTTDFDASFITRGKKHPLRLWWHSLHFRLKYLARPDKKRPHMVVIAQPDPANT